MEQDIQVHKIPSEADFLIAYSVVPGMYEHVCFRVVPGMYEHVCVRVVSVSSKSMLWRSTV